MSTTETPLRYPGGKTKLYPRIQPIVKANTNGAGTYIEPFAGGSGLALKLLFADEVSDIVLNDIDYSIYSFWKVCLNDADYLCSKIEDCTISIELWKHSREIINRGTQSSQNELAFSVLFLNRCNVSGILSAGPIGGLEQKGKYRLDARFNKGSLIEKIQRVYGNRNRIKLYNEDAFDFLAQLPLAHGGSNSLLNIDPPYVVKGPRLYTNAFNEADHERLASIISRLETKWIVTYDDCQLVRKLYENFRFKEIEIAHNVGKRKIGHELLIFGNGVIVPEGII